MDAQELGEVAGFARVVTKSVIPVGEHCISSSTATTAYPVAFP